MLATTTGLELEAIIFLAVVAEVRIQLQDEENLSIYKPFRNFGGTGKKLWLLNFKAAAFQVCYRPEGGFNF